MKSSTTMCTVLFSTPLLFMFSFLALPKIVTSPPQVITVKEGGNLSLDCEATGVPPPQMTWFKATRPLPATTFFPGQVKAVRLLFEKLTYEDTGLYRCEAKNAVGKTSIYVEIMFEGKFVLSP